MISIKKLAVTGAVAGLMLASAVPALAHGTIQKNWANVNNNISASSSTGDNQIKSWDGKVKGSSIKTGDAGTLVGVSTVANKNVAVNGGCGCGGFTLQKNGASVDNNVS